MAAASPVAMGAVWGKGGNSLLSMFVVNVLSQHFVYIYILYSLYKAPRDCKNFAILGWVFLRGGGFLEGRGIFSTSKFT